MTSAPAARPASRHALLTVRLALGFGALVGLMMVVIALASLQFRALAQHGDLLTRSGLKRVLQMQQIDQHVQGHGSAMARLLTSPRSEREHIYPMIDAEYAAIDGLIGTLSGDATDALTAARLAAVAARRNEYRAVFIDVASEIEAGDLASASAMFNGAGQAAMRSLLTASRELLGGEQAALAARQHEIQAQIRRSEWLLGGLALAAMGLSVLLAWRTTASVARPLTRVEDAARRIADGDYSARVELPPGNELGRVAQAMNIMATAVATREAEIKSVAYSDRLTGLPNRNMLRRLAGEVSGMAASVLLMDVARLRTVNEVLGFEAGDLLLRQIAERLRATLAAAGTPQGKLTLARLPGGVFAVLCPGLDRAGVEALRERLDAAVSVAMACAGHSVDVHLVFGLADAAPGLRAGGDAGVPDINIDSLLQRAELAVIEAKRRHLKWAWHVPADDAARARQLSLLSQLHHAAQNGELEMWLQPKQCLRSGHIAGMEALVRWRHPERGFVAPAEFIPFAERAGHIGVVTTAMLGAALRMLASWAGPHPELSIAVNVSALDLGDTAFARRVEQEARRLNAPLQRLRLEITESAVMEDANRVLPVLHALRAIGVQLSIDDFGTGYSSLAYLHRLPVSELKIDRSFVAGADHKPEARALLATIIELGHNLKMTVTAEGIERTEERELLAELGCDMAQGYLIARPMAPEAAAHYVERLAQRA